MKKLEGDKIVDIEEESEAFGEEYEVSEEDPKEFEKGMNPELEAKP